MTAPTPADMLDELDDASDDECIYIDRPDDAYIWREDDETYIILERSRSGSWFPAGRPVPKGRAIDYLEANGGDVEVRPQTELPPGRHTVDRQ